MNIIFLKRIEHWYILILLNIFVIILTLLLAYYDYNKNNFWLRQLHLWYYAPLIFVTFKELYLMIRPIRNVDFDHLLIAADRWIFGCDPTIALEKIANPFLTELLQISYGTFYFLPIILAMALYLKNNKLESDYVIFSVVYGFFLSYIGYFILPAIGPRFTIHNFDTTNQELPGIFLTNILREIVNSGESIPKGTINPALIVQRDVFPSGHTMMTLIVMYLSIKLNSRSKYFLIPNGLLLIFATVYLRYHYFIDLVGGSVLMIFSVWSGKIIFNSWQNFIKGPLFNYPSEKK